MNKPQSLSPAQLRARPSIEFISVADSGEIPLMVRSLAAQPRAEVAIETALHIAGMEYNVFLAGPPNLGRVFMAVNFLEPRAANLPTPPDWIYVNNFDDPDRPSAISLAPGEGRKFKTSLADIVRKVRDEVPACFERESYLKKKEKLQRVFNDSKNQLLAKMEDTAQKEGFDLNLDEQGALTLSPLLDGKVVGVADFERLEPDLRDKLKSRGDKLLENVLGMLRKISRKERDLRENEHALDAQIIEGVLAEFLDPLIAEYEYNEKLREWLKSLRKDILENPDNLKPSDGSPPSMQPDGNPSPHPEDFFLRYGINLIVDNSKMQGAPIVIPDTCTHFGLLGALERESEWGALFTDFSLIKAGAMHRANGGFLILRADELLKYPSAWEGLMRALRLGFSRIEDPGEHLDVIRTKTIEPEPIPLNVKVILVGDDDIYDLLLSGDPNFSKLFKIKAHLRDMAARDREGVDHFLLSIGNVIRDAGLLPFDRQALAGVVDYSSRLCEDQRKISLRFPLIREIMIEASALARSQNLTAVSGETLVKAIANREFRTNLYEEEFMDEYDRDLIKVATTGHAVGRANGLSVSWFGDFELGLPHQISCTVGVGHGGILDLERESELGGPIHTKGMMIIKSLLISLFASKRPLVLTGSLCFEQNYAGVEGDSASGAELCALLSALSGVPINLSLAFTGAVSQSGAILAVGGVNRKIEGFFEVCRRRGLTGEQGVILPYDNISHLMLKDDVIDAVGQGRFHVYPVRTIEEAIELLTGVPAGKRLKNGRFPKNSIYALVDKRLEELAVLAESEPKKQKAKPAKKKA